MMHGLEKSDLAVVAMKPANNAGSPAAEWAEPRAGTKGNANPPRTRRTQSRDSVSQGLERVRQAARQRKRQAFTALLHHVTADALREAFLALKRRAAPGVDGVTWQDYELGLEDRLQDLHTRGHRGTYRALPVRRRFIPKPDGRQRPLGIAALLKSANLAASSGEGNRLIDGGGVRVDSNVVSDKGLKLGAGTYVLQVGKRKFARVTLA